VDPSPVAPRFTRPALVAALVLAAVAVAVRLLGLGRESLWLDEGATWRMARLSIGGLIEAARADVHPPLFPLLEHFVVRIAGDREAVLRLVPAIASCLTLPLAARLAWRAFGARAAWGVAALLSLSAFQVHYAQEARSYALFGLLALASAETFLASIEHGRRRDRAAWIVVTVALLYTHTHALFVVAAEKLAVLWMARRPGGRRVALELGVPAVLIVLAFLPWAGVMAAQVARVAEGFWIARPSTLELVRTLAEFAGSVPMLAPLGLLVAMGLLRPSRPATPGRSPARALVVLLASFPIVAPFLISLLGPPVYLTRAAIPASLALAILAAAGWAALPRWPGIALGALVLLGSVPPLVDQHRLLHKEPWRDVVAELERQARPGDLVLVTAPWYRDGVFDYYERRTDLDVRRFPLHAGPITAADIDALRPALASHARVWLVRARAEDPERLLPAALAEGHLELSHHDWEIAPTGPTRARRLRAIETRFYAARR